MLAKFVTLLSDHLKNISMLVRAITAVQILGTP